MKNQVDGQESSGESTQNVFKSIDFPNKTKSDQSVIKKMFMFFLMINLLCNVFSLDRHTHFWCIIVRYLILNQFAQSVQKCRDVIKEEKQF